jgi:hypothetical protein
MTSEQLSVIKGYQKSYHDRFGERLEIDWLSMKGIKLKYVTPLEDYKDDSISNDNLQGLLDEVLDKYGVDLSSIRAIRRIGKKLYHKERRALVEFSKIVVANNLNQQAAADLINKDRTMIHYYSNETKV